MKILLVAAIALTAVGLGLAGRSTPRSGSVASLIDGENGTYIVNARVSTHLGRSQISDGELTISAYGCPGDCNGPAQLTVVKSGVTYTIAKFERAYKMRKALDWKVVGNQVKAKVQEDDGSARWVKVEID